MFSFFFQVATKQSSAVKSHSYIIYLRGRKITSKSASSSSDVYVYNEQKRVISSICRRAYILTFSAGDNIDCLSSTSCMKRVIRRSAWLSRASKHQKWNHLTWKAAYFYSGNFSQVLHIHTSIYLRVKMVYNHRATSHI